MKLPNLEQAHIPAEKARDYLLNVEHEDGRGKALFFIHFGFSARHWKDLAQALLVHAQENEVNKAEQTPFGIRYVIEGALWTPVQRCPQVRVVWFIAYNQTIPRLVTAYPLEG